MCEWARDARAGLAGRRRVREWKALVWGGVISGIVGTDSAEPPCSVAAFVVKIRATHRGTFFSSCVRAGQTNTQPIKGLG
jgi:hypothetical protein